MYKIALLFLAVALEASLHVFAQVQPQELTEKLVQRSTKSHSFRFYVSKREFDPKNHDISKINETLIDGRRAFGIDNSVPHNEFDKFELTIDGKAVPIDRRFYGGFFGPNFGYNDGTEYLNAYWGKDYKSVFVFMNGGDGAGAYTVVWHFTKDGRHSYSLVPDCDVTFKFKNNP